VELLATEDPDVTSIAESPPLPVDELVDGLLGQAQSAKQP
jgi:hypothetical protein